MFSAGAADQRGVMDEPFIESAAPGELFNAASLKQFKNRLAKLKQEHHYHFPFGGQWCIHELVTYLLSITGPADIWKSTWAISEPVVRDIMYLQEKKVIRSIRCIFDYKTVEQKSKAYHLAQTNFTQVTLTHSHAKVTVLKNEKWCITVFGSANDNRNPRVERGCICTVKAVAEDDIRWMEALMRKEKIFSVRK